MKIQPIKKLTVNNYEDKYASWLGFKISKENNYLVLSKSEKRIGEFVAIELFASYAVFIVHSETSVFVVNSSAVKSGQHSSVGPYIFESRGKLYVCVKRYLEGYKKRYFNVIEISQMTYLYNRFCEWPQWLDLSWVEYPIFVIEYVKGRYSFFFSENLRLEPMISFVSKYQRLSDGSFIVQSEVGEKYIKITAEGKISPEKCSGFLTGASLKKNFLGGNLTAFHQSVVECVLLLLKVSDRDRITEALETLVYDRLMDLKGLSLRFDRYIESIENSVNIENQVDRDFLKKIKSYLMSDERIEDYEICCHYFLRTISDPYELFLKLCEDSKLGVHVKRAADAIIKEKRDAIELTDVQLKTSLRLLVDDLADGKNEVCEEPGLYAPYNAEHLELYKKQFKELKRTYRGGFPSPHKPVLLLAVISLIEKGILKSDVVEMSVELESEFKRIWEQKVKQNMPFSCNIGMPFWHMKTEPFWQMFSKDTPITENSAPIYSVKVLREKVNVLLEKDLYDLLQNGYCRKELSDVLLSML